MAITSVRNINFSSPNNTKVSFNNQSIADTCSFKGSLPHRITRFRQVEQTIALKIEKIKTVNDLRKFLARLHDNGQIKYTDKDITTICNTRLAQSNKQSRRDIAVIAQTEGIYASSQKYYKPKDSKTLFSIINGISADELHEKAELANDKEFLSIINELEGAHKFKAPSKNEDLANSVVASVLSSPINLIKDNIQKHGSLRTLVDHYSNKHENGIKIAINRDVESANRLNARQSKTPINKKPQSGSFLGNLAKIFETLVFPVI
jgi:hypothetical protein